MRSNRSSRRPTRWWRQAEGRWSLQTAWLLHAIVDWDGDGLFDILCGGSKGGVYLFKNTGQRKAPQFAAAETLIAPIKDTSNSYITRVPAKDGQPTLPGSSYHIEPVDFDLDGDLDLLVGARSSWLNESHKDLSDKDKKRLEEIDTGMEEIREKLLAASAEAKTEEAQKELAQDESYLKLVKEYQKLAKERRKYRTNPTETGDFVWVFRRK